MNELTYTRIGDYWLPDIKLSDPPDAPPLGKYGMMHKREVPAGRKARAVCIPAAHRTPVSIMQGSRRSHRPSAGNDT